MGLGVVRGRYGFILGSSRSTRVQITLINREQIISFTLGPFPVLIIKIKRIPNFFVKSGKLIIQSPVACVASDSVWFRSKERPRNGIFGFGRARKEARAKKLPALLLAPFFARSLTLVPRSLLLNRTETLATQAKAPDY